MGLTFSFAPVVRYMVTTFAGLRSTSKMFLLMNFTFSPIWISFPFLTASLRRRLLSSIPTPLAPNSFAAMMTILPSPDPRSYRVSPGLRSANSSIFLTTGSGEATKGAIDPIPVNDNSSLNV